MFELGSILRRFVRTMGERERVTEVDGDTVTTEFDGATFIYRGCIGRYQVGQEIETPIRYRNKSIRLVPSVWYGAEEDD